MALLISIDYHTVLRQLLLNKDHLLGSLDHEISAWIQRTFVGLGEFGGRLA